MLVTILLSAVTGVVVGGLLYVVHYCGWRVGYEMGMCDSIVLENSPTFEGEVPLDDRY